MHASPPSLTSLTQGVTLGVHSGATLRASKGPDDLMKQNLELELMLSPMEVEEEEEELLLQQQQLEKQDNRGSGGEDSEGEMEETW